MFNLMYQTLYFIIKFNKMKKTLTAIFLFVTCLITFISCNKTSEQSENTKPILTETPLLNLKINLSNQNFNLGKVSLSNNLKTQDFKVVDSRMTIIDYESFENSLNSMLGEETSSIYTVFYFDSNSPINNTLEEKSIIAVSKYYQDGNMIQHDFFNKINGNFIKDKYLSAHVSTITNNGIFRVNEKVLKINNNTILTITSDKDAILKTKLDNTTDILRILANAYYDLKNGINEQNVTEEKLYLFINMRPAPDDGNGCKGAPCYEDGKFCYRQTQGSKCEPNSGGGGGGGCFRNNNNNILLASENSIPTDSLNIINNDNLHYSLRDFLTNTEIGRKYIHYYYFFGEQYLGKVNFPLAIKTARFLYEFNTQINKLLNPSTYGQNIFLDSNLKNKIIEIMNDYKNVYNDVYNNALLNDMLNDLNFYENKTVDQVRATF